MPRATGAMPAPRWDRLLRTAAQEFAEQGYQQASLNRIITRVGLSKSSFYHYVASKEALFDAVLAEFTPPLLAAIAPPDPEQLTQDYWAQLAATVRRLIAAGRTDPTFHHLGRMWYLPGPSPDTVTVSTAGTDPTDPTRANATVGFDSWLRRTLEIGRAIGAVRDDLPVELQTRMLRTVIQIFDEWWLNHQPDVSIATDAVLDDLADAQFATVRRLVGTTI